MVVRPATWTLLHVLRVALGPSPVLQQARRRAEGAAVAA
jgi:hypothetical protein